MMVITQMFEWLNLFKVIINKTIEITNHQILLFFFAFVLLPLERITILYVNIDKASNAYCLATLINTRCNKQKISLDYWSKSNENDKTGIDRFFLITNFCVKIVAIVANTKKNLVGAYWLKIKIKKEQTLLIWWLSVGLQTVW